MGFCAAGSMEQLDFSEETCEDLAKILSLKGLFSGGEETSKGKRGMIIQDFAEILKVWPGASASQASGLDSAARGCFNNYGHFSSGFKLPLKGHNGAVTITRNPVLSRIPEHIPMIFFRLLLPP